MTSYGNSETPKDCTYAEYDYLNGEYTGKYFTSSEAIEYEDSYDDNGHLHLSLEPIE